MFRALYTFCLHIYGLALLPRILLRPKGRPRMSWFGQGTPEGVNAPLIWIHAASLGETLAMRSLITRLREEHPTAYLLMTTTTATGQAAAKQLGVDHCCYLPFDLPYLIRPLVRRLKPAMVILSETDLWFHFLDEAQAVGAKVCLVNGKISERSFHRFRKMAPLARRLFGAIDLFCVQDDTYRQRFLDLGVPSEKIVVAGNLKLDVTPSPRVGLPEGLELVTIGSTHDPEEKELLTRLVPILQRRAALCFLLVPRHPERFEAVAALLGDLGIPWGRWSLKDQLTGNERIVLIDAMGLLNGCYAMSQLAIVAGSFTSHVGGHNVLEPLQNGTPVLFGPHMHNQAQMAHQLLEQGGARQVSLGEIAGTVDHLLSHPADREELTAKGKKTLSKMRGALDRTYTELKNIGLPC